MSTSVSRSALSPAQPDLAALMLQAGFASADWTNLSLGIAALHIARV